MAKMSTSKGAELLKTALTVAVMVAAVKFVLSKIPPLAGFVAYL